MLLNIGSRDVPFAKTLTWVEDVRASSQVGADGAKLLKEKGFEKAKIGLVDSGQGFPLPQLEEMKTALPQVNWQTVPPMLQPLRLVKTAQELAAMREAGRLLQEICAGAEGFIKSGTKGIRDRRRHRSAGARQGRRRHPHSRRREEIEPPSFKQTDTLADTGRFTWPCSTSAIGPKPDGLSSCLATSKLKDAYQKAQEIVVGMAKQLKPNGAVAAIDETARRELGEFYGDGFRVRPRQTASGSTSGRHRFLSESDAREVGAASVGATMLNENMTLALRVAFETEGKLILFGDSFEVTAGGAKSLLGG